MLASDADSKALTQAPEITMISFTGSTQGGKLISSQAVGKRTAMELGGNGWVGVFPDVSPDLFPAITQRIIETGFGQAGQGCLSVQNVTIWHERAGELVDALRQATENVCYGDTSSAEVISGPVISRRSADRITGELEKAQRSWEVVRSRRLVGAPAEDYRAQLIPPSLVVMDRLPTQDSIAVEEIFGPVVTVSSFDDTDQLIEQINGSRYGLQTGIYTDHWPTIQRLYRTLQVGGLNVNDVTALKYDHAPFGGVKDSGHGREGVRYAMEEMTEGRFLSLSANVPFAAPDSVQRRPHQRRTGYSD